MLLDSFSSKSQSQDLAPQPDFPKTIIIGRRNVEILLRAFDAKALPKRANGLLLPLHILLRRSSANALPTALHAGHHHPHRVLRTAHLPQLADAHDKLASLVHRALLHGQPRARHPQRRHLALDQGAQRIPLARRHRDHRLRHRAARAPPVHRHERPRPVLRQRHHVQLPRLRPLGVVACVRRPQRSRVQLPAALRRRVVRFQEAVRQRVELRGGRRVRRGEDPAVVSGRLVVGFVTRWAGCGAEYCRHA